MKSGLLFVALTCNIAQESIDDMVIKLSAYQDYSSEVGAVKLVSASLYTSQNAFLSVFNDAIQWPLKAVVRYFARQIEEDILIIKGATEFIKVNPQFTLTVAHVEQREQLIALENKAAKFLNQIRQPDPALPKSLVEISQLLSLFFDTVKGYYEALEHNSYNFSDEDFDKDWGSRVVEIDF